MASTSGWPFIVWASRNSHRCVGKQVCFWCVRVWTCVLWPLKIICPLLREKKNIKIFIFYETEAFWESPLSLLACSRVSLASISIPGLSRSQKATFLQNEIVKGHVPPALCSQAPALGGKGLMKKASVVGATNLEELKKATAMFLASLCLSLGQILGTDWDTLLPASLLGQHFLPIVICGRELDKSHISFQLPCQDIVNIMLSLHREYLKYGHPALPLNSRELREVSLLYMMLLECSLQYYWFGAKHMNPIITD